VKTESAMTNVKYNPKAHEILNFIQMCQYFTTGLSRVLFFFTHPSCWCFVLYIMYFGIVYIFLAPACAMPVMVLLNKKAPAPQNEMREIGGVNKYHFKSCPNANQRSFAPAFDISNELRPCISAWRL